MIEIPCKIGTFLKGMISSKKVNSPTSKAVAKTKEGNAAATSGDNSPIYFGDVNNYPMSIKQETTAYTNAWENLINAFSPQAAKRIVSMITDPRSKEHGKTNLERHKKWASDRFKQVDLDHRDPRSAEFNRIRKEAIASIDVVYENGNSSQFEAAWDGYLQALEAIKSESISPPTS